MKLPAFVEQYLLAFKIGAVVLVLGGAFVAGMQLQSWRKAGEIGALNTKVATLEGQVANAAESLAAKDSALKIVAAEVERRRAEAESYRLRVTAAEKIAQAAVEQLRSKDTASKKRLDAARDRSPTCAALLATDIDKVCKL